jgi:multiple sugar transport system substrate-binding protein
MPKSPDGAANTAADHPAPSQETSLSRRRLIQAGGIAGLAAIAAPLFAPRTVFAAQKTLKILQWSPFVPSYDKWFDQFAKEWGEKNGVNVVVDHISIADLVTTTSSELSAKSGHDLIELGPEAAQFAPSLLDMADINQEVTKACGTPFYVAKRVSYNPVVKTWYSFCHGWTIDAGDYRYSLWKKAGMPQGPGSWADVLDIGAQIRDKQGVQVGIGMSQELDSNMVARAVMWAWDTYIQDEWDDVVLGSGVFKRRAIEAVKYMADLYHKAMTPAVFAWNAASNNQDLLAGKASYIVNSVSAYRSAQKTKPDIAKDVFFTGPLAGPNGTRWANVHVLYNYIIPKFAKAHEDTAKQFIKHLAENYDQAMYNSELYNSPSYFQTAVPKGDRGYPAVKDATTLQDLNDAWFTNDPFKLDGEADGKLIPLMGATNWTTNLGHPGYSNPATGEVFNTFILPNMMAKAARGSLKPEEAVDQAAKQIEKVYDSWRKRGLIGGKA